MIFILSLNWCYISFIYQSTEAGLLKDVSLAGREQNQTSLKEVHKVLRKSLIMPGGLHPPLEVIESWPAPDYEHPERQGVELVVLTIFFSSFGIAAVGARIYSRVIITKAPGWDDALAVMSLVSWSRV